MADTPTTQAASVEGLMELANEWADAAHLKGLGEPHFDIDSIRERLRDCAARLASTSAAPSEQPDAPNANAFYLGGPYHDGTYSICEVLTGRVRWVFNPATDDHHVESDALFRQSRGVNTRGGVEVAAPSGDSAGVPSDAWKEKLALLERLAHRAGELWERCQGKGWPDAESGEFTRLRDERLPAIRAELVALSAASSSAPAGEPVATKLRVLLNELRPMAAYGVVGSRDVDQARYQRAIAEIDALLAPPSPSAADLIDPAALYHFPPEMGASVVRVTAAAPAAPQARLTDERIRELIDGIDFSRMVTADDLFFLIARAIEREAVSLHAGDAAGQAVEKAGVLLRADEQYRKAVALVLEFGHPSVSLVQRKLGIRYMDAQGLIARMVRDGVVSVDDVPGGAAVLGARSATPGEGA